MTPNGSWSSRHDASPVSGGSLQGGHLYLTYNSHSEWARPPPRGLHQGPNKGPNGPRQTPNPPRRLFIGCKERSRGERVPLQAVLIFLAGVNIAPMALRCPGATCDPPGRNNRAFYPLPQGGNLPRPA